MAEVGATGVCGGVTKRGVRGGHSPPINPGDPPRCVATTVHLKLLQLWMCCYADGRGHRSLNIASSLAVLMKVIDYCSKYFCHDLVSLRINDLSLKETQ